MERRLYGGCPILQACQPNGYAHWIFEETIRRERAMCHPLAERLFGTNGTFWRQPDAQGMTAPPHRLRGWATARDQKVMSDVAASSCCGRPTYSKMMPATATVINQTR